MFRLKVIPIMEDHHVWHSRHHRHLHAGGGGLGLCGLWGWGSAFFNLSLRPSGSGESTALVGLGLAGVAVLAGFSVSDLDAPRRQTSPRCAGARGFDPDAIIARHIAWRKATARSGPAPAQRVSTASDGAGFGRRIAG
jgi:hypothetical protein